jgi:hypothetical protein
MERTRRFFASVLLVSALSCVVAPRPVTAATLSFSPLNGSTTIGDTLTVQVTIDAVGPDDLQGFSFVLEFDPTVVSPASVGTGALVDSASCPNFFTWLNAAAVGDSIAVDVATLGCSVAGPGDLVELQFVGVNVGTSPLQWRSVTLRDSLNVNIPTTCVDGTIDVQMAISVASRTWGRIKSDYRTPVVRP